MGALPPKSAGGGHPFYFYGAILSAGNPGACQTSAPIHKSGKSTLHFIEMNGAVFGQYW